MYRLRTLGGLAIERDGAALDQNRVHRKAHALLAVLAAQGAMTRERLMALLWPESDADHAKGSLKQATHLLRRELSAPDLLLGTAELRLNPVVIESDVSLFSRALEAGEVETAVGHYGGPFLDGVYVDGAGELERWIEARRAELARKYLSGLELLADAADARGDLTAAIGWWRQLQSADPLNGRVAVRLMLALDAAGDRAGALRHARILEQLLVEEWGISPDPAVAALAERLRAAAPSAMAGSRPARAAEAEPALPPASPPPPPPAGAGVRPRGSGWRIPAALAVTVLLLAGGYRLASFAERGTAAPRPMLAVGTFEEHGIAGRTELAGAAADMLATNLARVPGLQVVSSARMHEVRAQLAGMADAQASVADAARRAGASELLEGVLYHTPGGALRLDLRRVDLRTGTVRGAQAVEAGDLFQLVDRATLDLAGALGLSSAAPRLDEITTSVVAYRFYEEGLRSFTVADFRTAERLLSAAVAEDTLFAIAAHYLWATRAALHQPMPDTAYERLRRLSERAPDRERLIMRASWSTEPGSEAYRAVAETLAIRYPSEPEGHLLLGMSRQNAGDFVGSLPQLRRVVVMDSLGLRGTLPRCQACAALASMVNAYIDVDSLRAAERTARFWVRRQPRSGGALAALAYTLELQGRQEEALSARRSAAALNPIDYHDALYPAIVRIRTGQFAAADDLLRGQLRDGTPEMRREARWWLTISLRHQGRLREALTTIRSLPRDTSAAQRYPQLLLEGQVLFELGRFGDAARVFESAAELPPQRSLPSEARRKAWALTHLAAALAAAGDTAGLAALVGRVEWWGGRSTFGRDRRLHHHLRGLLLEARGDPHGAVAEFRRAVFSPTTGYTRTNLEEGRVLIALGRPRDAIAALSPPLRGPLEASAMYVTHSDLHALLGRAWEAAGRPDSAAVHYRRARDAWTHADPELQPQRARMQARLTALRR